jgi:hypothetical protein
MGIVQAGCGTEGQPAVAQHDVNERKLHARVSVWTKGDDLIRCHNVKDTGVGLAQQIRQNDGQGGSQCGAKDEAVGTLQGTGCMNLVMLGVHVLPQEFVLVAGVVADVLNEINSIEEGGKLQEPAGVGNRLHETGVAQDFQLSTVEDDCGKEGSQEHAKEGLPFNLVVMIVVMRIFALAVAVLLPAM